MSWFICNDCTDSGVFFASAKCSGTIAPYVFRCICQTGAHDRRKLVPQWSAEWARYFVPEFTDARLHDSWVVEETNAGRHTGEHFKVRLEIWGRDRFEEAWKTRAVEKVKI